MKPLASALGFLSVFPLPARWQDEASLARSLPYFPVAGLLFGVVAGGTAAVLAAALPAAPAAVLVVMVLALISGGLHLDGLADTADGFFSSRSKERILEIMRDSRTGAMGAAAVACVVVLKSAALMPLGPHWFVRAALLMPLAGRCSVVLAMTWLPYAREGGGLAMVFGRARWWHAAWSVAVLAAVGWLAAGWRGVAATAAVVVVTGLMQWWSWSKIGGYTGDTLGATCEIAEVVPALVLGSQLWQGGLQ